MDEAGKFVIPPTFEGAQGFREDGLAIVHVAGPTPYRRLQGFVDRNGKLAVPARYELLRPYDGGLAAFSKSERWGAIDRQGREAFPPRLRSLGGFGDNGLAPASEEGSYGDPKARFGYVDRTGRFVIPQSFASAGSFKPTPADGGMDSPEGLARVVLPGGDGAYIDSSGKIVTRFPAGLYVWGISPNGLVRIQVPGAAKFGFADRNGAIVIAPRFEQVGGFDEHGLASATEKGKAGYIRADGSWAIEPRFSSTGSFDEFGQAQAVENGKNVLIDRSGAVVARLEHGANFHWQRSEYTAFKFLPPQVDLPPERFGRWLLERRLYAVPEFPDFGPTAASSIRLTFTTEDGTVRWGVKTEGWTLDAFTEQGPENANDVTSEDQLTEVPTRSELVALLTRQMRGVTGFRLQMTPGKAEEQAVQRERLRTAAARRAGHLAELAAAAPDLDRALEALRAHIAEHYGKLSGPPCLPPQCLY